jgi:hypothetical protein
MSPPAACSRTRGRHGILSPGRLRLLRRGRGLGWLRRGRGLVQELLEEIGGGRGGRGSVRLEQVLEQVGQRLRRRPLGLGLGARAARPARAPPRSEPPPRARAVLVGALVAVFSQ